MWNNKNKAVTFSYDDGAFQDIRLVGIFNKYGLKCTFNLCSTLLINQTPIDINGNIIPRVPMEMLSEVYKGHEIAVHTCNHMHLTEFSNEEISREIADDKKNLEELFNCDIVGMAYPYGDYDNRVIKSAESCGIRYARTVCDTHNFDASENLLELGMTCRHKDENILGLIDKFLSYNGNEPKILSIWGHSYEFYLRDNWELIEKICQKIAFRDDVFYGTNREIYL